MLLHRFISYVQLRSFGPVFFLPGHLMTRKDSPLFLHSHYPPLLFQPAWMLLSGEDVYPCGAGCRCSAGEDFVFEGNTLTSFPFWRKN